MLSKSATRATAVLLMLLSVSCARVLPWRNEPARSELNLAFTIERNLIELQTVQLDGRSGRFILGSAARQTVVDPSFASSVGRVQLSENDSVRIDPALVSLGGVADAIIGTEPWRRHAISIDYRIGLVTFQRQGIVPGYMTIYRYEAEPTIYVNINGRNVAAVVDTTNPDTVTLPGPPSTRGVADVRIADTSFGSIDVGYADVTKARVGNRLLSKFLVTIDYGQRVVGLWRDPRIAM